MTSFYALMKVPRQWIWNFLELEFSNTLCTDTTLWLDVTVINAVNLFFSNYSSNNGNFYNNALNMMKYPNVNI